MAANLAACWHTKALGARTSLPPLNNEAHVALLVARRPFQLNLLL